MSEEKKALNFLEQIVEKDLAHGMSKDDLRFRFPPEPNGYLHIGHTKAIGISFGLGIKYNAPVNLRFDDTNPEKEEQEYVDAIKKDIAWLGYSWDKEVYSSDYFEQLYLWAVKLIKEGKAYVDSQSSEAMAEQKGAPTQPGVDGPYRNRSVSENLNIFERMKKGEFEEGSHILRAKIDMQHPNMLMRDPIMYRILKKNHNRTGNEWCIYPMYDWAHGECDYIEQISHSLCSLEFKPHRELYDWFLDQVVVRGKMRPKQREFARLNLSYTIMSKRKLLTLVQEGIVNGWDDPRMPTISGLRRRGYTPNAIRKFIETVGVAKRDNVIDVSLLEFCIREDLNITAPRVMAVLNPVKLVISNYPQEKEEWLEAENNQEDELAGYRKVPFSRELYIEKEDFKEQAGNKYFRLTLGKEVRLKNAYIIKGESIVKDAAGNILEIHCTYDKLTLSGSEASMRKVKGTLHWVSVKHAKKAEVREYDRLFLDEAPDNHQGQSYMDFVNPDSLNTIEAYVEPSLKDASIGDRFQFQRLGYFNVDDNSNSNLLVFNKTVGLRDSWEKQKPGKKTKQNKPKPEANKYQRPAIEIIKQLGKKYTNLPVEKQKKTKAEIQELAKEVSYKDLEPLFNTAVKKVGTRIATIITLGVLLNKDLDINKGINEFILKALQDNNELLVAEAKLI